MTRSILLFPILWCLGLAACSEELQDNTVPQTEASHAENALAGVLPPQRCERLQLKLTSQGAITGTTINVPGPYKASLSSDGKSMSCTGPTGDYTPSSFLEDFFIPSQVQFRLVGNNTGIVVIPGLPDQQTTIRWQGVPLGPNTRDWTSSTNLISCHPYTATISAPGFGEQKIDMIAELNGLPGQRGHIFRAGCRYRVKGPITITRDRPADVTGTNGDSFVFAPPPFCDGDDCQTPACPPANQCSVASDCGAPSRFTCTNGCCLTIIR